VFVRGAKQLITTSPLNMHDTTPSLPPATEHVD